MGTIFKMIADGTTNPSPIREHICPPLVPKKTFLMPHVLAGNVSQVEAILKQLHHQVTRDDVTGLQTDGELMSCNGHNTTSPHSSPTRDGSKRHHSESTHDGVPSKRLKVDLTTSDGPHLFISEEGPRLCHLPSCLPTSDGAIPMTSLLERTAGNASILHVCCQLDPAEEGEGCQATPLAEQDAKFKVYRGMCVCQTGEEEWMKCIGKRL